jgi:hypothetical protein
MRYLPREDGLSVDKLSIIHRSADSVAVSSLKNRNAAWASMHHIVKACMIITASNAS